jgi:hypothetical protein
VVNVFYQEKFMHSRDSDREWLQQEFALHRKGGDHCWKSLNPFGHQSCVGYMTMAQELFNHTKTKKDLALWKMAVDRAEEYVQTKYARYYSVVKRIRYPQANVTDSVNKDEDHAKTIEHMAYIANQRELICNGEEFLKDIEFQRLTAVVETNKTNFEKTQNKAELKIWKASLDNAKQYLKEIKRDKNFLGLQVDAYNRAENEYNKQHSCVRRYFFWCCADSVDVLERDEDKQVNADGNRTPYVRLLGQ